MTKYQIINPDGVKVCIISACSMAITPERTIFYGTPQTVNSYSEIITTIPSGWVAIPIDVIVNEAGIEYELKVKDIAEIKVGDNVTADAQTALNEWMEKNKKPR